MTEPYCMSHYNNTEAMYCVDFSIGGLLASVLLVNFLTTREVLADWGSTEPSIVWPIQH